MKKSERQIKSLIDELVVKNKELEEKVAANDGLNQTNDAITLIKTQTAIAKILKK